jgi:predicted nucleic acid-binding protein
LAGDELAVSDLTRMEALVGPLRTGNTAALTAFAAFFSAAGLHVFSLTADVCNRAAPIRAVHRFRTPDALQLATAVENGCGLFLTNDAQLARFSGVRVEVLT